MNTADETRVEIVFLQRLNYLSRRLVVLISWSQRLFQFILTCIP